MRQRIVWGGTCALMFSACSIVQCFAESQQYAYVTTQDESTVVAIDTANDTMVTEIPLSIGWTDVARTADGRLAYVVNSAADSLTVIDLHTDSIVGAISVNHRPERIALSPDGRHGYVTGEPTVDIDLATGSMRALLDVPAQDVTVSRDGRYVYLAVLGFDGALLVLDTATGTLATAAPGFWADGLALSPAGQFVYLSANRAGRAESRLLAVDATSLAVISDVLIDPMNSSGSSSVVVSADGSTVYIATPGPIEAIDVVAGRLKGIVPGMLSPKRLAVSADGDRLYATGWSDGVLSVLDPLTLSETATIPIGTQPLGMVISPDDSRVYVAAADAFSAVDVKTNRVVDSLPSGIDPTGIAASRDGRVLYTANQASGSVAVIDAERRKITASIHTGGNPLGIALTPDGRRAYVSNFKIPGSVFVIDTATNTQVASVDLPGQEAGIAVTPDGRHVLVSNYYWNTISMIDVDTNAVVSEVGIQYGPKGIAVSSDGALALVGSEIPAAIQFLDLGGNASPAAHVTGSVDLTKLASQPCGIALRHDGSRAYVTDTHGDAVQAIDTVRRMVVAAVSIAAPYGADACGVALTPDERRVYVANDDNDLVTVLDAEDLHIIHHIPVLPRPYGIVIACPGGCSGPTPGPTPTPTPMPISSAFNGDCNRDGMITIDELMIGVNIALGNAPVAECESIDSNADGRVTIDELLHAVTDALVTCTQSNKVP